MGVINYSDQLKFTGKGYLDSKMMPVEKVSDLYNISITQRFEGLTITVLKDENGNSKPQDYWLIGGVSNSCWVPKTVSGSVSNYESGNGIVIENNVISIDNEITEKIDNLEKSIETEKMTREESINDIRTRLNTLFENVSENTKDIENNKTEINTLKERVNALSSAAEGSTPDGETIGITNDEKKALYVKILEKDGNILKVDNNDGEKGLYASIPVFFEDDEL